MRHILCQRQSWRSAAEAEIDRGDGQPSVNLVVLSFVHPLKLLNRATDAQTLSGVPRGMTPDVVNYFKNRGIRVMLLLGGITSMNAWNQTLTAKSLGVPTPMPSLQQQ